MDIVDININIHKHMLVPKHRHIMYVNNISYWLCINKDIINKKNKRIINNYKKFLNQKNIVIVMECIEYDIFIIPIIWCVFKNIVELIEKAFSCQNINMLKLISNNIGNISNHINNKTLIKHMKNSCKYGDLKIIKYLHQKIGLKKEDFQSNNNYACQHSYSHVDVVKYLHRNIGLSNKNFQSDYNYQSDHNYTCLWSCESGSLDVVKYLHKKIGLTKEVFQFNNNEACIVTCKYGRFDVVKYLHKEVGLIKKDFQSDNNLACQWACMNGHISVVKYLHQEIKLTKQDFQSENNHAHIWACACGYIEVVNYLYQVIGLRK